MTSMWENSTFNIGDLIDEVNAATLGLPQFQRLSVWGQKDWKPFLTTVLLNRPTGTLLLLEAGGDSTEFAPRSIESGPPLGSTPLKWLLLDGQQRTTTVFKAFQHGFPQKNGPNREFILDVRAALSRGELLEEDLKLESSAKAGNVIALAKEGKVPLRILPNGGQRMAWVYTYINEVQPGNPMAFEQLDESLRTVIPGFQTVASYQFPVLKIKKSTPLDVVVDIFEGMNRRGQKLNQFDLMVARLYKPMNDGTYYDLRKRFEDELSISPNLRLLGVTDEDGMLPLQLIAMQYTRLPKGAITKIKSLNNKDVLELPAEQIIGASGGGQQFPSLSLKSSMEALERAAEFLVAHCGVKSKNLLPQQSMLLPLADQFLLPASSQLTAAQMKTWFFAAGLTIDYYGGVNSYAARDCKELYEWAIDSAEKKPQAISKLNKTYVESLDLTQSMTREGAILGTAIMALLVANGAKDWSKGQVQVNAKSDDVEFHHMVADNLLKPFLRDKPDRLAIANFAPVASATNKSLGDKSPSEVIKQLGADAKPVLDSHRVNQELFMNASNDKKAFEAMLSDRAEQLRTFIIEALGL